jgi:dUTP pyrophosphatase
MESSMTTAPPTHAPPRVELRRIRPEQDSDIALPRYMSPLAAGADVSAAVVEALVVPPGTRALVPTGFAMALPPGWEAQVRPRSGLAFKRGLTVLNAPGTIDADYRGEVQVLVVNHGRESVTIRRGERIAQLVVAPCHQARFHEVEALDVTDRGEGGFGSTGTAGEPDH